MITVGTEIPGAHSTQGMHISHQTKLVLKTSKFRVQMWSAVIQNNVSEDSGGLSFSFPSCREWPTLAGNCCSEDCTSCRLQYRLVEFLLQRSTNWKVSQGCALAEPGGPWRLAFAPGQLENLRFFIQIICWAPLILQFQSIGLPSIFLRAQPCISKW